MDEGTAWVIIVLIITCGLVASQFIDSNVYHYKDNSEVDLEYFLGGVFQEDVKEGDIIFVSHAVSDVLFLKRLGDRDMLNDTATTIGISIDDYKSGEVGLIKIILNKDNALSTLSESQGGKE